MNHPNAREFELKENRIYRYLDEHKYEAVVIGTQANFSWLSGGGQSNVLITGEGADALAVITRQSKTLVAYNMDGQRNIDEELGGLGFDLIITRWNEKSREEIVLDLLKGKRFLSDIPLEGGFVSAAAFYDLHYPLTEWEIDRYRLLGKESEQIVKSVADRLAPGMKETEVAGLLMAEFSLKGYIPTVVLVGSDARNRKYRHPIPSDKTIDKTLLLVLCPRKYGLHVPITRTIQFGGSLEADLERRYEAASRIAANCIAHTEPGVKFSAILEMQKRLYQELGFADEWRNHFQGGITGYIPNDSTLCFDPEAQIVEHQTFNWFITITGVNTEDTILAGKGAPDIFTRSGEWPVKPYAANGKEVWLPQILIK
jgi:Xaa-Pro dipeptidase